MVWRGFDKDLRTTRDQTDLLFFLWLFCLWFFYAKEFNLENEDLIRSDLWSRPHLSIGEFWRDKKLPFSTFFHELETLCPTFYHCVESKCGRLTAFV